MNLVDLNPSLIEANRAIVRAARAAQCLHPPTEGKETLSGTIYNGHSAVCANATAGINRICVSFEVVVPSISAGAFCTFRKRVAEALGQRQESEIQRASTRPLAVVVGGQMSQYAICLFAHMFQRRGVEDGSAFFDKNAPFSVQGCVLKGCKEVLEAIRVLDVTKVRFEGTLEVDWAVDTPESVAVYIPVTTIAFSDYLTIPFAGYSERVKLSTDAAAPEVAVPRAFWTE